ncbi:MAG: DUF2505 family protein [Deltaproteobacteria bacterium]|nr:DUF2505 family protein [Deltaproteobacteria bacterium]
MAEFELVSEFPVPARRLFDLVRTPAFQEAMAFRFGASEVSVTEMEHKGDKVQMRIERADPKLDLTGKPSAGKLERSVILHDWDLPRMSSRWSRHYLDRGQMVTVEGTIRIEPKGDEACRLVEKGIVDIKIPLLGRSLEKRVIAKLEEHQPERVDFIMRNLGVPGI